MASTPYTWRHTYNSPALPVKAGVYEYIPKTRYHDPLLQRSGSEGWGLYMKKGWGLEKQIDM
jgi:nitrogen fixation protein